MSHLTLWLHSISPCRVLQAEFYIFKRAYENRTQITRRRGSFNSPAHADESTRRECCVWFDGLVWLRVRCLLLGTFFVVPHWSGRGSLALSIHRQRETIVYKKWIKLRKKSYETRFLNFNCYFAFYVELFYFLYFFIQHTTMIFRVFFTLFSLAVPNMSLCQQHSRRRLCKSSSSSSLLSYLFFTLSIYRYIVWNESHT